MGELRMNREQISCKQRNHLLKEIFEYKRLLEDYKVNFKDLTHSCPKHANIRKEAAKIARMISENNHLATFLKETKQLPIKELQKLVSESDKTIRKYHKYIIGLSLIYNGKFTYLKDYINL